VLTRPSKSSNGRWQRRNRACMWFRRVEEAAEQYTKRWFVKEKDNAAKRRALEPKNAQILDQDSVGPTPWEAAGGGY
ncbi:MAG: hypothetical protein ABJQ14_01110, partial [Hyphomicrobiales bacterium]